MNQQRYGVLARLAGVGLLALSATLPVRADYQSTVVDQGPVGYWRLNETTAPPYNSFATNLGSLGPSANGEYVGSPQHELAGPFAGSLAVGFDGIAQAVSTPWQAGLNTASFTFETWLAADVIPTFDYVASSVKMASPRSGWYLAQDDGGVFGAGSAYVVRMFNQNGAVPTTQLAAPITNTVGAWDHLVLTYDGTTAALYLNGVLITNHACAYVPNVSERFTVGCRSTLNFFWPGQAAETALYGTALTSAQVATHYSMAATNPASYAATVLADAPLVYYRYREASDVLAANLGSLGSAADATYQYGTAPGAVGPRPAAYPGFESSNTAVAVDASGASVSAPPLGLATNTVTISGWVKASGVQSNAAGIIVCNAGTTYAGLTVDVPYGGLGLGYVWNNEPSSYNWSPSVDSGLPALPDSEWAYVALVVRPDSASIYLALTNDASTFTGVTNYLAHVNEAFDGPTLFGSDGGDPSYSFNGAIDEVAIFDRALGVGELYSQYAAAVGGLPPKIFGGLEPPVDLYAGDTLTLSVDAGGTPALSYQWHKTGGPIAGATTSAYTKVNAQTSDSDTYTVIITNLYGSATGTVAVIVNAAFPPTIVAPPMGRTLYPGGTLSLSVVATGGGLKYQWQRFGTNLAGATTATYVKPAVTTADSGDYSVIVSNNVGTATAGPVTVTVLAPANDYEAAIVADAPEAWYRLNETNATTLFDSMGRHDGVYTNITGSPVTLSVPGAIVGSADTAVSFDGTSLSYGVVPYSPALNSQNFTIEAWVKTSDTAGRMCAVSSRSSTPQGYWLWTVPAGVWSGGVASGGNNYYVPSDTAAAAIVPGQWKHVVMVYGPSLRVYINGQWDGVSYVDFERNAGAPFIIGARGGGTVDTLMNGQVDEVLVYTNALTLAQVQNHYTKAKFPTPTPPFFLVQPSSDQVLSNAQATVTLSGSADGSAPITYQWYKDGVELAGRTNYFITVSATYSNAGSYVLRATNPSGFTNSAPATLAVLPPNPAYVSVTGALVLHLTFDGDYTDSSGRGNHATPVGSPSIVAGRLGSAVFLSTSNAIPEINYLTLGTPADLNFSSNVNFSVAYWVKYQPGQTNGDLPFLCSAVNSYGNPGFTFAPSYNRGGWSFSLNGTVQTYGDDNSINDGDWHHVLHSINRTGNVVTYLDGRPVDSRLATGAGDLDTGNTVNIGQDPTGAYPEDGSVTLDDLAVWRRALTSYEAYSVYYAATNANTSFTVPGTVALHIAASGTNVVLSWQPGPTLGTLLEADALTGPWTPVPVYVPVYEVPAAATQKFYRLTFPE